MSYDSRETSARAGDPFECYHFHQGASAWLYTSADTTISIPAGMFVPATVSRGQQEHSREAESGNVEVRLGRTDPVAALFIPYIPATPLLLTIWRGHRDDEALSIAIFIGRVTGCRFAGAEAILRCESNVARLRAPAPAVPFQLTCPWDLYGPGCGVSKTSFQDTCVVGAVSGSVVSSTDFGARADGWYTTGWLERSNGERRFIVNHVGNDVTLMSPFAGLATSESISAFAGCDRLRGTCDTKFSNLSRFGGFPWTPIRNPHDGRIG